MKRLTIIVLLLGLLISCEDIPQEKNTEDGLDTELIKVAEHMPTFGGMFVDDNGDLKVYLKENLQRWDESTRAARRERFEAIIANIFGERALYR